MGDFLAFRRMLMPVLIQIFFWIALFSSLALGVAILIDQFDPVPSANRLLPPEILNVQIVRDNLKLTTALYFLIVMPIVIRLWCEFWILIFRINGTLTDIRNTLILQREGVAVAPAVRH